MPFYYCMGIRVRVEITMKSSVVEKLAMLITSAFGLVAALAWNSAIQAIFVQVFGASESVGAMVTYAIIVTIIAVVATVWIGKLSGKVK